MVFTDASVRVVVAIVLLLVAACVGGPGDRSAGGNTQSPDSESPREPVEATIGGAEATIGGAAERFAPDDVPSTLEPGSGEAHDRVLVGGPRDEILAGWPLAQFLDGLRDEADAGGRVFPPFEVQDVGHVRDVAVWTDQLLVLADNRLTLLAVDDVDGTLRGTLDIPVPDVDGRPASNPRPAAVAATSDHVYVLLDADGHAAVAKINPLTAAATTHTYRYEGDPSGQVCISGGRAHLGLVGEVVSVGLDTLDEQARTTIDGNVAEIQCTDQAVWVAEYNDTQVSRLALPDLDPTLQRTWEGEGGRGIAVTDTQVFATDVSGRLIGCSTVDDQHCRSLRLGLVPRGVTIADGYAIAVLYGDSSLAVVDLDRWAVTGYMPAPAFPEGPWTD